MATKTLVGPNGEQRTFYEVTKDGQSKWVESEYQPELIKPVETPNKLPYNMSQGAVDSRNQSILANNQYEHSLVNDKEAQERKRTAEERGFMGSVYEGAKNVLKQFDSGTSTSPDFLPQKFFPPSIQPLIHDDVPDFKDILDYRIGGSDEWNEADHEGKVAIKDREMAPHNLQYKADRMESPAATTLGELAVYLGTGSVGDKALLNLLNKAGGVGKAAQIKSYDKLGNTFEANKLRNREPQIKDIFTKNLETAARGVGVGAAEGYADDSQTMGEGALYSGIGGTLGMMSPLKILDKVPSKGGNHAKTVRELEEQGYYLTPGVISKNKSLQTTEAGMRNSDALSDEVYNKVDAPNAARSMTKVGNAIGLDTKGEHLLTQKVLDDHMVKQSDVFQELERTSKGEINSGGIDSLRTVINEVKETDTRNKHDSARAEYRMLNDIMTELSENVTKNSSGNYSFDGTAYQKLSERINLLSKQAFKEGNEPLRRRLDKMGKVLDDSLESGMGADTAKVWKDAREKYALTNLLMEKGLKAHGVLDTRSLTSELMSGPEAKNTLRGVGTDKKKELQDVVRYNSFLEDVEGGTLTGLGKADRNMIGTDRGMIKRGVDMALKPAALTQLNYRLGNIKTPFVGKHLSPIKGIEPNATVKFNRALAQASPLTDMAGILNEEKDQKVKSMKELLSGLGL